MDIILGLLRVASVFVSFGEGDCRGEVGHVSALSVCLCEDDLNYPAIKVFFHPRGNERRTPAMCDTTFASKKRSRDEVKMMFSIAS
jgi:hypothetical protein